MFTMHCRAYDASWWVSAAAMLALTVATIAGNAALVSALWRARRAPRHYPRASLALADLLVGISVLPLAAARELFTFRLSWIICACWSTLDVLCCTASILSLCALGWERWSGITEPLALAKRAKWAKLLAVLVWPVATAVALPTAFIKSPAELETQIHKACTVNTNPNYVFISVTLSFYLPTCAMLVQYAQILRALSAQPPVRAHRGKAPKAELDQLKTCFRNTCQDTSVRLGVEDNSDLSGPAKAGSPAINDPITLVKVSHSPIKVPHSTVKVPHSPVKAPHSPGGNADRQMRATITIIRLMSMFLICWSPFFIMLPIDSLCKCVRNSTWQWCSWLGYANSALNPVVYAAAATSVRRVMRVASKVLYSR